MTASDGMVPDAAPETVRRLDVTSCSVPTPDASQLSKPAAVKTVVTVIFVLNTPELVTGPVVHGLPVIVPWRGSK